MNKNSRAFLVVVDFLWLVGFSVLLVMSYLITRQAYNLFYYKFFITKLYLITPLLILVFLHTYVLSAGVLYRLFVPRLKEGRYRVGSRQFVYWRISWHFYSYVFLFLQRYVFYNRYLRYMLLRLMRVNLQYSTYFAETVDLQDANNLLTLGENTGFGSEVTISTHLQMPNGKIIFGKVDIGKNCVISARCGIGPACTIGDNTQIGFGTLLSTAVTIGEGTIVGGNTVFHPHVKIGKNCRIGNHVVIPSRSIIPDNTIIPDCMVWGSPKKVEENNFEKALVGPTLKLSS